MIIKWVKTNDILKKIFSKYVWDLPNKENKIYLTFDDGPTPEVTNWVLEQLEQYNAKATFFCIGENVKKHSKIFQEIINKNHSVGNHTYNHLNGWKNSNKLYVENSQMCHSEMAKYQFNNPLIFRPPYGKIRPSQSKKLRKIGYKIILWDIISYDFDKDTSPEICLHNVLKNIQSGSIIVFHDSKKAYSNLQYVLPKVLEYSTKKGFVIDKI